MALCVLLLEQREDAEVGELHLLLISSLYGGYRLFLQLNVSSISSTTTSSHGDRRAEPGELGSREVPVSTLGQQVFFSPCHLLTWSLLNTCSMSL